MRLEILLSCMHQSDDTLVQNSNITGDVLVINQCDQEGETVYPTRDGRARIFSNRDRGLTKSRNLAIAKSCADICLLCDDDEQFTPNYEKVILDAYGAIPQADIIAFKVMGQPKTLPDRVMQLRFPKLLNVSSWQISFRRDSLINSGVRFDELLGAGSGNGAEEELKFLLDCRRAGLKIWYVPTVIATVGQGDSTWFHGFDREFFYNRGATTRYILGIPLAFAYGLFYVIKKYPKYKNNLSHTQAMAALLRGIKDNKVGQQRKALDNSRKDPS